MEIHFNIPLYKKYYIIYKIIYNKFLSIKGNLEWYIKFKNEINEFNPCVVNNNNNNFISNYKNNEENANNIIIEDGNNKLMEKICSPGIYNNKSHIFHTLNKEISSCIISYFIDYFNFIGGYKVLFRLIYSVNVLKEDNFNILFNIQYSLINDLFTAKAITDSFYNSNQEEIQKLKEYAINYLDKLNQNNFDKISKLELSKLCNKIFNLTEKDKQKKEILLENFNINYLIKQIQFSKKLESKISFLTELNNIIKSLEDNDLHQKINEEKNKESKKKLQNKNKEYKQMNSTYFCKICQEKQILQIYLNDNTIHEEIIKRLAPLLKLMYSKNYGYPDNENNTINENTNNIIEILFKKLKEAEKNNENLWKIINEIIIDFSKILSDEQKFFVFLKIKEYLIENIKTSSKIIPIFSFFINFSLECISKKKNIDINVNTEEFNILMNVNFEENELFCLNMLVDFYLDKMKLRGLKINKGQKLDLINLSKSAIIDILKIINNGKIATIIFTKIIIAIVSNINTIQNILLLENIINLYSKNLQFRKDIKNLCEKASIIKSLTNKFYEYFTKMESLITTNVINKHEVNDINNDNYDFEINIQKRLDFIFMLLNKENKITFKFEEFLKFFQIVIQKNILNIDDEFRKYILEKILLNKEIFKINDLLSYNLFKVFILETNKLNKKFKFITEKEMHVITDNYGTDICGFDILWDKLLENEDKEIQNNIAEFIKNIIFGVRYTTKTEYEDFWKRIITKIIYILKNSIENNKEDKNSIKGLIILIKKIIEESNNDGEIIQDKNIINTLLFDSRRNIEIIDINNELNQNNIISIKVLLDYNNTNFNKNEKENNKKKYSSLSIGKEKFEIFKNEKFYQLKYYISYKYKIPLRCIEIEFDLNMNSKNKNKNENEIKRYKLNYFNDNFKFGILFKDLKENININNKKEEEFISININKIQNPLNNKGINNIKNLINNNEELQKIFMNLLKNKNGNYIRDIWKIIKDKNDLSKNEKLLYKNFNDLINNEENKDLLNDICNFENTSMLYTNFILSSLYKFLESKNNQEQIIQKFINSSIWIRIKNLLEAKRMAGCAILFF